MTSSEGGLEVSDDAGNGLPRDWFTDVVECDAVTDGRAGARHPRPITGPDSAPRVEPLPRSEAAGPARAGEPVLATIARQLIDRYRQLPSWALLLQLFLAGGWARAALAHILSADWWNGTEVLDFLATRTDAHVAAYGPVLSGIVESLPTATAIVILAVELAIAVLLLLNLRVGLALGLGALLNVQFMLAGVVTPSIFYLVASLGLAIWLLETATDPETGRRVIRIATIGGVASIVALAPSVRTIDPAAVIDDPALSLIFVATLSLIALWLVARRAVPVGGDLGPAADGMAGSGGGFLDDRPVSLPWSALWLAAAAAILLIGFGVLGNRGDTSAGERGVGSTAGATEAVAIADPDGTELGTSASPYPFGQQVTLSYDVPDRATPRAWELQVLETSIGTDEAIGRRQAVLARLRITHVEGPGDGPLTELGLDVVGPSGRVHPPGGEACQGAETFDADAPLGLGEVREGWQCWTVPADEVGSVVLAIEAEPAYGVVYLALR